MSVMAERTGRKSALWHVVKMRKHEMRAGVFFKRVANKGPSVESRESVTQVTFTAVKQSTSGLGSALGHDGSNSSTGEGKGVRGILGHNGYRW